MKTTVREYPQSSHTTVRKSITQNTLLLFALFTMAFATAQEHKPIPQINVSGEGKVKATPDQVFVSVSVDTKGNKAADVKRDNDAAVQKVVQAIKMHNLPKEDVQTKRISLNPVYDYEKKKYSYNASQTIDILLKDLNKYDALMESLVDAGINRISNVEFRSSKIEQLKSDARRQAMLEAKKKADDYVSVIGQKVGKALTISDNTQVYYPQPMYEMKAMAMGGDAAPRETLAIGEINVTANVSVTFFLE